MKRLASRAGALAAAVMCATAFGAASAEAETVSTSRCLGAQSGVKFFDNFSSAASLNPWAVASGSSSGQLQRYTTRALSVSGGNLNITAFRHGTGYRSARVSTLGHCELLYGSVQARIRTPAGQGLWPAFWLEDQGDKHEIDVMETLGERPTLYYAGVHTASIWDMHSAAGPFAGSWHVYGVLWTPRRVVFTVDGHPFCTRNDVIATPLGIVLDLAVSSDWGGPPDASTPFPSVMQVGWVKAYKLGSEPPLLQPTAQQCQLQY